MKKNLSVFEVFAIALGAIIGWGSFMLPGTKFLYEGGVINTFIGLFSGAVCIYFIEKSYAVMLQSDVGEGGEFSYVYKFLGKDFAFIVGWFLLLAYITMIPLNLVAFPLVVNKLFSDGLNVFPLYTLAGETVYGGKILISLIVLMAFFIINLTGVKNTGRFQKVIIILLLVSVVYVFLEMIIKTGFSELSENYIKTYRFDIKSILTIFAVSPFLYVGFDSVPQLAENLSFSKAKASVLTVFSLFSGMIIYNILNITTALAYSPDEAIRYDWALGSAVYENIGTSGFIFLVVALGCAVSSGINGFMVCSSKLMGAMGKYRTIPEIFSKTNSKDVFSYSVYFIDAVSLILTFFGRQVILWIVDMSSLGAAVAYAFVCYVTYKTQKSRKIKVFGIIGLLSGLIFILLLLLPFSPAHLGKESVLLLIVWIVLGTVFWLRKREGTE